MRSWINIKRAVNYNDIRKNIMGKELLYLISLNPRLRNYKDWNCIFRLVEEQSVIGVALKGVQKLPADKWPPRNVLLQWIGCCNAIEQQNEKVNVVLSKLIAELEGRGINPIIVKGQVAAQEYEEPLARQSGDIDVLIRKSDWIKTELWLKEKNFVVTTTAAERHVEINYDGVTVELHHQLNAFSDKNAMLY